jgi:hypothetical protein
VRLFRASVTAWVSQDGSSWIHVEEASPAIPPDALIGIAGTSHQGGILTAATLDSLTR